MNYIPSSCGLFGIMRKNGSEKIPGTIPVKCLNSIRYRGSNKGSGYASFNVNHNNNYSINVFYEEDEHKLRSLLEQNGFGINKMEVRNGNNIKSYCYDVSIGDMSSIDNVNDVLWKEGTGRIYSSGTSLDIFKGIGYPDDVGKEYSIESKEADMWLAHTRQPTNSPGSLPYWSHPFSSFNIAIVHNGDISSFGANREFLKSKGVNSFVGTDSEVIAYIFRELLKQYDLITTVKIMAGKIEDSGMKYKNRGAVLDGPYTLVIGYDDGNDLYMICIADRTKLRPAILGEDDGNFFIASEESQIRLISPDARIWTLEPDSYFITSFNRGIISPGRKGIENRNKINIPDSFQIDAGAIEYNRLNQAILKGDQAITINNVAGHRYIGINFPDSEKDITIYGTPGNCFMNLNENNSSTIYGNVADDCCDSMGGGMVKIYGDAGDILCQAFNGGKVYVLGNAGNRACIQMREYVDKSTVVVINGKFDDYLGEYMSGGTLLVLSNSDRNFGRYIGSGMIGGTIFIRGKVNSRNVGIQPPETAVNGMLNALRKSELITDKEYHKLKGMSFIDMIKFLPPGSRKFVRKFYSGHELPEYEYRYLNSQEKIKLNSILKEFDTEMGTHSTEFLGDKFTIIMPGNY